MKTQSAVVVLLLAPTLAFAATGPSDGITVEGVCNRSVVPDRGAITVTADALEKDVKSAVAKATSAYETVRAAVKKLPLENMEIETSEYSVQEERAWEKDRQVSKGFRARMGFRVTSSSIQKLGEVIAAASREGIRDVGALSTYLSPEKLKQEQMGCLEEAALHARSKADKLAAALGTKVGGLISLSESRADLPRPMPMMAKAMRGGMEAMDAAPSVDAGKQDIATSVYATFSLR